MKGKTEAGVSTGKGESMGSIPDVGREIEENKESRVEGWGGGTVFDVENGEEVFDDQERTLGKKTKLLEMWVMKVPSEKKEQI